MKSFFVILTILFAFAQFLLAETRVVGNGYTTITEAIAASSDGDTILVMTGTYTQAITLQASRNLYIRSDLDGDPATYDINPALTIIDVGSGYLNTFTMQNNNSTIEGFRLVNAKNGFHLTNSNAIIKNNIISNMDFPTNVNFGDGIHMFNSSPTITGNLIYEVTGRGIHIDGDTTGTTSPIIINNTVVDCGYYAYIDASSFWINGNPVIFNNIIAREDGPTIIGVAWGTYVDPLIGYNLMSNISNEYTQYVFGWQPRDGGEGSLSEAVLFYNAPLRDYTLADNSPGINDGTPEIYDGETLIWEITDFIGSAPEMGAFESDFANSPPYIIGLPSNINLTSGGFTTLNIWDYVSDETPDNQLIYMFESTTDSVIINPVLVNTNGSVHIIANADYSGISQVFMRVYDSEGDSATASIIINVGGIINTPPYFIAELDSIQLQTDSTFHLNLWDWVRDNQTGDIYLDYTFSITNDSIEIDFLWNTGVLNLTPLNGFFGEAFLNITVKDPSQDSVSIDVKLIVSNSPGDEVYPVFSNLPELITVIPSEPFILNVWDLVLDAQTSDTGLIYYFSSENDSLLLDFSEEEGLLSISPIANFHGNTTLFITAEDPQLHTRLASIPVFVEQGEVTNTPSENKFSQSFDLKQNYPNPFNPVTTITYHLIQNGQVELAIFNLTGQKIETLISENQNAGVHFVTWSANHLASGLYISRLNFIANNQEHVAIKRMLLIK